MSRNISSYSEFVVNQHLPFPSIPFQSHLFGYFRNLFCLHDLRISHPFPQECGGKKSTTKSDQNDKTNDKPQTEGRARCLYWEMSIIKNNGYLTLLSYYFLSFALLFSLNSSFCACVCAWDWVHFRTATRTELLCPSSTDR